MSPLLVTVATEFLERQGLAPLTIRSYELTLLPLLKEYGCLPIELLTLEYLQNYLNNLKDIKYTTPNRHQTVINALFNFAVSSGYIKSNPMARLSLRKPEAAKREHLPDEPVHYLTSEQVTSPTLLYE